MTTPADLEGLVARCRSNAIEYARAARRLNERKAETPFADADEVMHQAARDITELCDELAAVLSMIDLRGSAMTDHAALVQQAETLTACNCNYERRRLEGVLPKSVHTNWCNAITPAHLLIAQLCEALRVAEQGLRAQFCARHIGILDGNSHFGYDADSPRSADGTGGCGLCIGERLEFRLDVFVAARDRLVPLIDKLKLPTRRAQTVLNAMKAQANHNRASAMGPWLLKLQAALSEDTALIEAVATDALAQIGETPTALD